MPAMLPSLTLHLQQCDSLQHISLAPGQILRLKGRVAFELRLHKGQLWLTVPDDPLDYFVQASTRLPLACAEDVLIENDGTCTTDLDVCVSLPVPRVVTAAQPQAPRSTQAANSALALLRGTRVRALLGF